MEDLLNLAVSLDILIMDYEEWSNVIKTMELRKIVYETYGVDDLETAKTLNQIELDTPEAVALRDGYLKELFERSGLEDLSAVRQHIIEIKTLLNAYSRRISDDFIASRGLDAKSKDELMLMAQSLVGEIYE